MVVGPQIRSFLRDGRGRANASKQRVGPSPGPRIVYDRTKRLVEVVDIFPRNGISDGSRLVKAAYVWPCFTTDCRNVVLVSPKVYHGLMAGYITGVKCVSCLTPPDGGLVLAG